MYVGQPVHLYFVEPTGDNFRISGPLAGTVVYVNEDGTANLNYLSTNGDSHGKCSVPFVESPDGEEDGDYCCPIPVEKSPVQEAAEKGFRS